MSCVNVFSLSEGTCGKVAYSISLFVGIRARERRIYSSLCWGTRYTGNAVVSNWFVWREELVGGRAPQVNFRRWWMLQHGLPQATAGTQTLSRPDYCTYAVGVCRNSRLFSACPCCVQQYHRLSVFCMPLSSIPLVYRSYAA